MLIASGTTIAIKGDGSPSFLGVFVFAAKVFVFAIGVIVVRKSRRK